MQQNLEAQHLVAQMDICVHVLLTILSCEETCIRFPATCCGQHSNSGPASDGIKATKPGLVWVAVGGAVPREGEGERDLGLIFKRVVFPISTYSLGAWDISDGFQGGSN